MPTSRVDAKWTPERLVALRVKLFLTQPELAAKVGVSTRQVSRWETGQGQPYLRHAKELTELEKNGAGKG